jgi:hypothetical protein
MKRRPMKLQRRPAAIIVLTAFLMVFMLGLLAFSIDRFVRSRGVRRAGKWI